ncbi:MAG: tetratricopeptide repeat protein [Myxococcales bacterium]|nr:tetratricopeptide repeat protein [Myxococcales bacterium]
MTPDAPVWPQLEPLVAALEADLKLPRSTRVFPVSTETLTRVAKVFVSACHRTLDVRLRFDTRALCSSWPQGRAQKDDTWHLDAFINTFLLPPPIAKWFDGATQVDPVDDVEAAAQDEAFAEGAVVDAPLLVFALGCFWSAWLIHQGQGRWVGPETIDLDQAEQAPPGLTVSGCVSFTFPFGRIASRLRTPGDTLWATGHRLVNDAVPPIGLAFSMDDADTSALLPEPAASAMAALSEDTLLETLSKFDEALTATPGHPLLLTLAGGIASSLPTLHRAAEYSRRALAAHATLDARFRLADILRCIGEPPALAEAIALFRVVLDEQSEMHRARLKLAQCLYESGDEASAVVELQRLATKGWGEEADKAKDLLEQLGIPPSAT